LTSNQPDRVRIKNNNHINKGVIDMANYNYMEAMKDDILDYCSDNSIDLETYDLDALHDELWTVDSVTGNASGSYTFNRWTARDYVLSNMDLLGEAVTEFGIEGQVWDKIHKEDWEYLDVTIRCYLLYQAINEAKDAII
jgi:hypothetical protein